MTGLTLARKAAEAPWQQSVEHWLRAVARRLALQARSSAERRRGRQITPGYSGEHDPPEPCDPRSDPLAEVARRELRLVLDEELGRLPEKYRAPMVLCDLEGKTNEQAAGELGWPAGSMSRRLARARALLHDRLTRLTVDNFYPHTEYSPEGGGPFTSRGAAAGEGAGLEPAGRCRLSGGEATRRFWLGLSRGAARSGCGATSTQSRARPPSPAPTPRRPVCR
jgi:RNA polymerase sigma factor (sigma-70 family)